MARPRKKFDDVEIKKIEASLRRMQVSASHPLKPLWPIIQSLIAHGHNLGDIHANLGGDGITLDRRSLTSLVKMMDGAAGAPKSHSEKERAPQPKTSPAPKNDAVSSRDGSSVDSAPKPVADTYAAQSEKRSEISAPRPDAVSIENRAQGQQLRPDGARPRTSAEGDLPDQFRTPHKAPQEASSRDGEQLQWPPQTTRRPEAQANNQGEGPARETRLENRPSEAASRTAVPTGVGE